MHHKLLPFLKKNFYKYTAVQAHSKKKNCLDPRSPSLFSPINLLFFTLKLLKLYSAHNSLLDLVLKCFQLHGFTRRSPTKTTIDPELLTSGQSMVPILLDLIAVFELINTVSFLKHVLQLIPRMQFS